jgi:hypothetical protein
LYPTALGARNLRGDYGTSRRPRPLAARRMSAGSASVRAISSGIMAFQSGVRPNGRRIRRCGRRGGVASG